MDQVKNYSDTYLYSKGDYEKDLFKAIMSYDRIDKDSQAFKDIEYDVKKRQTTSILTKVLVNKSIVLLHNRSKPLVQAFKVFAAKDLRGDKHLKIFVDVSDIFIDKGGEWQCTAIDVFVARLVSAMTNFVYYKDFPRIQNNSNIAINGAIVYSKLMTNIIDNLFKISVEESKKIIVQYLCAKFYLVNILGKDQDSESVKNIAQKASGIGDAQIKLLSPFEDDDSYGNIKNFIALIADILKIKKLQLENVVDKWVFLYGRGTHMGLELFPSFATIVTDAYANAYINNQRTIEKIIEKYMNDFTKSIFSIGEIYFR